MKIELESVEEKPVFKPMKLVITIDTQEDLNSWVWMMTQVNRRFSTPRYLAIANKVLEVLPSA